MKRMTLTFVLCMLLGSPAMAVPSLGWSRGAPGSTFQMWTFNNGDNPAIPELCNNPYGTPAATIADNGAGYFAKYLGRKGVWGNSPAPLGISLYIPNREARSSWKDITIEIGYRGQITGVMVYPIPKSDPVELTLAEPPFLVDPVNLWKRAVYTGRIYPNPDAEMIFISAIGSGGFIDYIAVDTMCIPAPGAILLGGVGAGCVGWLRRRRAF